MAAVPVAAARASLALVLVASLAVAPLACGARAARAPEPAVLTGVVAHRGASVEAPENTLAAFRRAWALGAESCELDVRVSADGAVVVMHDATTARTGGVDRPVAAQTLAELAALDVGAWFGPAFAGERVPLLAEVLAAMPAGRMLFVEVKTGAADAEAIARVITDTPRAPGAWVALQGYDADALAAVGARLPGVPTYWDVDPPAGEDGQPRPYGDEVIAAARARGFTGLALDVRGVDERVREAIAAAGLELDVWTVDDAAALATWRGRARWVETNRPERAR